MGSISGIGAGSVLSASADATGSAPSQTGELVAIGALKQALDTSQSLALRALAAIETGVGRNVDIGA